MGAGCWSRWPVGVLPAVVLLAACGTDDRGSHALATQRQLAARVACTAAGRQALARELRVPADQISSAPSIGNNAEPQCTFTAKRTGRAAIAVLVNVDSSPQPYFRLERQDVEMSQLLAPVRLQPAPIPVMGLGIEAFWFPELDQLGATDGRRLITGQVLSAGIGRRAQRAIDAAVIRPYLALTSLNTPLARGYP